MTKLALILAACLALACAPAAAAHALRVPRLHGQSLASARRTLRADHLRAGRLTYTVRGGVAVGHVVSVTPRAGGRAPRSRRIALLIRRRSGTAPASPAALPGAGLAPPTVAPAALIGVGNVPGCLAGADPTPYLRQYGAQILRVILPAGRPDLDGGALGCLQAAAAAGYRIHLAIQYLNDWTPARVAEYVAHELDLYGPLAWAVSIGNEQELRQGAAGQTGAQYAAAWRAAEPVLAALAPRAIRVAGEISPWGQPFLAHALAAGLPGVQALAAHPYAGPDSFAVASILAWAQTLDLPIWFTEGLGGPGAWGSDLTLAQMAGATVADAWLGLGS